MMDISVQLTVDDMEKLLDSARQAGTVDRWATLALEFIKAQEQRLELRRPHGMQ